MFENSLIQKLNQVLCNRVLEKNLDFENYNRIQIWLFVKEIRVKKDKIYLDGIKTCGYVFTGGDVKQEFRDIAYKMSMGEGIIRFLIEHAIWSVIMSRLKHFNINKSDVEIGRIDFLKIKRFLRHTQKMIDCP